MRGARYPLLGLLAMLAMAACEGDETFMIVTIDSVPAVHDVAKIEVDLDNEGQTRGDSFSTDDLAFPATFSIALGGRTGNLAIVVSARDEDGLLVGRGGTSTTTVEPTAALTLDSADFVINTDFADDQFPSNDFESHGFQVGAGTDGTWTAVYRDKCSDPCNMFARRFDVAGLPLESGLAAGTNGFAVSTTLSDGFFTTPATATSSAGTIIVWNFEDAPPSTIRGIACRAIDAQGNGVGNQVTISAETVTPFAVSAVPLANGKFAVAWNATATDNKTRGAIVDSQCQVTGLLDISTVAGTVGAIRPSVASNADRVMYTWTLDDAARMRMMTDANTQVTGDVVLANPTATEVVEFTRVTKLGAGFGVFVRWGAVPSTGPGKIELYRISAAGAAAGAPTLITTNTASSFDSAQGFSVTTRNDGLMLVAWHTCGTIGDDSGCGVFGRLVDSTGQPVGEEFNLATTTENDQTSPSVVGLPGAFAAVWRDASMQEPDPAGTSVRGRVLYPPGEGGTSAKPDRVPTQLPTVIWDYAGSSSAR